MKKNTVAIILTSIVLILIGVSLRLYKYISINTDTDKVKDIVPSSLTEKLKVPDEYSRKDKNNNGISDPIDISNNLKEQLESKIKYVDGYYNGGYPPDDIGVCSDVIWRAFKSIDVNLKELVDNDIASNLNDYKRVGGMIDKNIDFRRVPNLKVYFDKYCRIETIEIKPGDVNSLKEWQPGDVILYLSPYEHVGIVSDERDEDGVPWVIHNARPEMTKSKLNWFEDYDLLHYRWNY